MKICPIAIVVGCKKCPVFKICPVKTLVGDLPETPEPEVRAAVASTARPSPVTHTRSTKPKATVKPVAKPMSTARAKAAKPAAELAAKQGPAAAKSAPKNATVK